MSVRLVGMVMRSRVGRLLLIWAVGMESTTLMRNIDVARSGRDGSRCIADCVSEYPWAPYTARVFYCLAKRFIHAVLDCSRNCHYWLEGRQKRRSHRGMPGACRRSFDSGIHFDPHRIGASYARGIDRISARPCAGFAHVRDKELDSVSWVWRTIYPTKVDPSIRKLG